VNSKREAALPPVDFSFVESDFELLAVDVLPLTAGCLSFFVAVTFVATHSESSLCRIFHIAPVALSKAFISTMKFPKSAVSTEIKSCNLCGKTFAADSSKGFGAPEQHLLAAHSDVIFAKVGCPAEPSIKFTSHHVQDLLLARKVLGTFVTKRDGIAQSFSLLQPIRDASDSLQIESLTYSVTPASTQLLLDSRQWLHADTKALSSPKALSLHLSTPFNDQLKVKSLEWNSKDLGVLHSTSNVFLMDYAACTLIKSFAVVEPGTLRDVIVLKSSLYDQLTLLALTSQGKLVSFKHKFVESPANTPTAPDLTSASRFAHLLQLVTPKPISFSATAPVDFLPCHRAESEPNGSAIGFSCHNEGFPFSVELGFAPSCLSHIVVNYEFMVPMDTLKSQPCFASALVSSSTDSTPVAHASETQLLEIVSNDGGEHSVQYKASNMLLLDSSGIVFSFY
jgi:hypothetical protein